VVGSYVAKFLPEQTMGSSTMIAMGLIGLRFIFKPVMTTKEQMEAIPKRKRIIGSVIGGALVGFTCGFVGAGGGMMMLFVLTTFLGYELHIAVGTSVFIMSFTALTGSISHFAIGGMPDYVCLISCVVFTLIWSIIASKIANKVDSKILNRIVGIVLIIVCVVSLIFNYL
ncbi:MAG: sulfite exporter TauE/SafE family protein, partial [Clostridia bacterium]|nr:sulfite exporter TauE/SafE family protein [Clostridia bacterium]